MFHYSITNTASNQAFLQICLAFENIYPDCQKEKLLIDVDGTCIQVYFVEGYEIKVLNDMEVDAVYIESALALPEIRI